MSQLARAVGAADILVPGGPRALYNVVMIKSCFTDILAGTSGRVPAIERDLTHFSESLTGAHSLLASIRHGTRP